MIEFSDAPTAEEKAFVILKKTNTESK